MSPGESSARRLYYGEDLFGDELGGSPSVAECRARHNALDPDYLVRNRVTLY